MLANHLQPCSALSCSSLTPDVSAQLVQLCPSRISSSSSVADSSFSTCSLFICQARQEVRHYLPIRPLCQHRRCSIVPVWSWSPRTWLLSSMFRKQSTQRCFAVHRAVIGVEPHPFYMWFSECLMKPISALSCLTLLLSVGVHPGALSQRNHVEFVFAFHCHAANA